MRKRCGLTDPSIIDPFSPFLPTEIDVTLICFYRIPIIKYYCVGTVCQKLVILFSLVSLNTILLEIHEAEYLKALFGYLDIWFSCGFCNSKCNWTEVTA